MTTIKIKSNLYKNENEFLFLNEVTQKEEPILEKKFQKTDYTKCYLPYKFDEFIQLLVKAYPSEEEFSILFEGTKIEYDEIENVLKQYNGTKNFTLIPPNRFLQSGESVLTEIKNCFENLEQFVLRNTQHDNVAQITNDITKLKGIYDKSIIPVCVVGNYSSGKSSFINSIIGYEYFPEADNPTTHAIYQIEKSSSNIHGRISFSDDNNTKISLTYKENIIDKIDPPTFKTSELYKKLSEEINKEKINTLEGLIRKSLENINSQKGNETKSISSIIKVEVPFNSFVLESIDTSYIFFDIPGQNSALSKDDYNTFEQAMSNFTNGLVICLCNNDTKVSKDNLDFINQIKNIKEFDSRFSFVVINKVDRADFFERPTSVAEVQNKDDNLKIMEKFTSSKLFFASSHMATFAKKGKFLYLTKTYPDPTPNDPKIYQYNILPKLQYEDMKKSAEQTQIPSCVKKPILYVNSGFYSIEREISEFAKKYSSYTKCFQSKKFFNKILDLTKMNIDFYEEDLNTKIRNLNCELEKNKNFVIGDIKKCCNKYKFSFDYTNIVNLIIKNENYQLNIEELSEIEESSKQNDVDFNNKREEHENSAIDLKRSGIQLSEDVKKIVSSTKDVSVSNRIKELGSDIKQITEALIAERKKTISIADKIKHNNVVMNNMYENVTSQWNRKVDEISKDCVCKIVQDCNNKIKSTKEQLINILQNDKSLDQNISMELQKRIQNVVFENINATGQEKIPMKSITKGLLPFYLSIDKKKAEESYKNTMEDTVKEFCKKKTNEQRLLFNQGIDKLFKTLCDKILELHPKLRELTKDIDKAQHNIEVLKETKTEIEESQKKISELMEL